MARRAPFPRYPPPARFPAAQRGAANLPLQGGPHLRHRVVPPRGVDGTKVLPLLVVVFIEPGLEHPYQRGIQAVQPDHRRIGVVGVIVP
jgi:hypothetical protein